MTNKSALIKTDFFYKKYHGNMKLDCEIDVLHETDKGLLIIEVFEDGTYSSKYWIPKSKIISIEYVKKLPSEVRREYDRHTETLKELGHKNSFTFEEYYKKVNE